MLTRKTWMTIAGMAVGLTVVSLIVYNGTSDTKGKLESCVMSASVYVKANYEAESTSIVKDEDGYMVTETKTIYYDTRVSEIYRAVTVDGKIISTSKGANFENGYYVPDIPPTGEFDLDGFVGTSNSYATSGSAIVSGTSVPLSSSIYIDCLMYLNSEVTYTSLFSKPLFVTFE